MRSINSRDGNDYLASGSLPPGSGLGSEIGSGVAVPAREALRRCVADNATPATLYYGFEANSVWDEPPGALEVERNLRAWRRSVKLFTTQQTALTAFSVQVQPHSRVQARSFSVCIMVCIVRPPPLRL